MNALLQEEKSSGDPVVRQQAFNGIHQLELKDFPFVVEFSLFVQHASLFSLHQSLLLSIGGLIYLFADRDMRAAFFNT